MMLDSLCDSIRHARESFRGCTWETEFGPRRLNLRGLHSRQALLAAKATRGEESQCWKSAAEWLVLVETDANRAAEYATAAINWVHLGDVMAAARQLDLAIALESKYPSQGNFLRCRSLLEGLSPDSATTN